MNRTLAIALTFVAVFLVIGLVLTSLSALVSGNLGPVEFTIVLVVAVLGATCAALRVSRRRKDSQN